MTGTAAKTRSLRSRYFMDSVRLVLGMLIIGAVPNGVANRKLSSCSKRAGDLASLTTHHNRCTAPLPSAKGLAKPLLISPRTAVVAPSNSFFAFLVQSSCSTDQALHLTLLTEGTSGPSLHLQVEPRLEDACSASVGQKLRRSTQVETTEVDL